MRHRPVVKIDARDWLMNAALGQCSPVTRGLWLEARLYMAAEQRASISGTLESLARLLRCNVGHLDIACKEITGNGIGHVSQAGGKITWSCPEMAEELKAARDRREAGAKRQDQHRKRNPK